jgi:hypothetical protein
METLAITDYEVLTPTLARVVVSYTGAPTRARIVDMILSKFDRLAAPVENSFRQVKAGVAVGFIRANREVRVVDDNEIRASYRVMSSNIMMDNRDRSLWEVREGRGGKFLARHGQEDLSELVEAQVFRRTDIPALRNIATAAAVKNEFASFVSKTGDMDHGFVLATSKDKSRIQVMSVTTKMPEVVDMVCVTALARVPVPKSFKAQMVKAGISTEDKTQAKDYWEKLYSYDPDYLAMVKEQVDETTFA